MDKELLSKIMKGCVQPELTVAFWDMGLSQTSPGRAPLHLTRSFCSRSPEVTENSSSQRNSLEEGMKPEQRTGSMSG